MMGGLSWTRTVLAWLCAALLGACGGASPGADGVPAGSAIEPAGEEANALALTVDNGPTLLLVAGGAALNTLYASVTVCGGANACQTIDHVLVDTGSVGLRIFASALADAGSLPEVTDPGTQRPLRECVQYANGYTWGSIVTADVKIAGRPLTGLQVNLIGDPRAGSAPPGCVSGPAKDSVTAFGANGVLGLGGFTRDCGDACAQRPLAGWYYHCPPAGSGALCQPTTVALARQVANPVAALERDNNGVTIELAPVPADGAAVARGTLFLGVDTRQNNAARAARFFAVDQNGTLQTTYLGQSQLALIDSGTNAYVFNDASIATCSRHRQFYCPVEGSAPEHSALITGRNGVEQTVDFAVDNVDDAYQGQAALPGAAAPGASLVGDARGVFFWGLPFFFGRTVHVLLEGKRAAGVAGPAIGF